MGQQASSFNEANPHVLAAIVETAQTQSIVADQDICDERGVKLWARGQPVSASLQQRLLERKLREPLEACLRAADGVTNVHLVEQLTELLQQADPIALMMQPHQATVEQELRSVPLHSAVQLLLTAARSTRLPVFQHAVRAMGLAGAMAVSVGMDHKQVRTAMLGGLLHDLGEMYLDPQYLDTSQPLDMAGYRHVVSHPVIGRRLIEQLTDYPADLALAIGEHHERLDGFGYPARRSGPQLSPLGRMLAVVELVLGVAAHGPLPLSRATFAMTLVPGEFDPHWAGFVAVAARAHEAAPHPAATAEDQQTLGTLMARVTDAQRIAVELANQAAAAATVRQLASRVAERLLRLQIGINSVGLWSTGALATADGFELGRAVRELQYRLRSLWRDCAWFEGPLSAPDETAVAPLRSALQGPDNTGG